MRRDKKIVRKVCSFFLVFAMVAGFFPGMSPTVSAADSIDIYQQGFEPPFTTVGNNYIQQGSGGDTKWGYSSNTAVVLNSIPQNNQVYRMVNGTPQKEEQSINFTTTGSSYTGENNYYLYKDLNDNSAKPSFTVGDTIVVEARLKFPQINTTRYVLFSLGSAKDDKLKATICMLRAYAPPAGYADPSLGEAGRIEFGVEKPATVVNKDTPTFRKYGASQPLDTEKWYNVQFVIYPDTENINTSTDYFMDAFMDGVKILDGSTAVNAPVITNDDVTNSTFIRFNTTSNTAKVDVDYVNVYVAGDNTVTHTPAAAATNVELDQKITLTSKNGFDKDTLDDIVLTKTTDGTPISLNGYMVDTVDCKKVTFNFGILSSNTNYTVNISGLKDVTGKGIIGENSFSFVTKQNDPLAVVTYAPPNNATDVETGTTSFELTFNNAVDPATLEAGDITVTPNDVSVASVTPSEDQKVFTVNLGSRMKQNTQYSFSIPGVTDVFGAGLDVNYSLATGAAPALTLESQVPANNATNVLVSKLPMNITLTFNSAIDPNTVEAGDINITAGSAEIASVAASDMNTKFTITLANPLPYSELNRININGITDINGQTMNIEYAFTTAAPLSRYEDFEEMAAGQEPDDSKDKGFDFVAENNPKPNNQVVDIDGKKYLNAKAIKGEAADGTDQNIGAFAPQAFSLYNHKIIYNTRIKIKDGTDTGSQTRIRMNTNDSNQLHLVLFQDNKIGIFDYSGGAKDKTGGTWVFDNDEWYDISILLDYSTVPQPEMSVYIFGDKGTDYSMENVPLIAEDITSATGSTPEQDWINTANGIYLYSNKKDNGNEMLIDHLELYEDVGGFSVNNLGFSSYTLAEGNISAYVTAKNTTGRDKQVTVIVAQYSGIGGTYTLVNTNMNTVNIPGNTISEVVSCPITVGGLEEESIVRAFVWDMSTMQPLVKEPMRIH